MSCLLRGVEILDAALDASRVAKDDPIAKLREANVLNFADVRADVLETTGGISVLHGPELQVRLLDGVDRSRDGLDTANGYDRDAT